MNTGTTQRVVIESANTVVLVDGPAPTPGPDEVVVHPRVIGICGSDLHILSGHHPFVPLPCTPGHEVSGVVASIGTAVDRVAVGDRVMVEPLLVCGECLHCSNGRYNLCRNRKVIGSRAPGGMGEAVLVPAARLHRVPDTVSDAQAALVEPLSTGTHAVRVAGDLTGRRAVILGGGSIGLLTLLAANEAGAAAVVVTDLVASKQAAAKRLGAVAAVDPTTGDVVEEIVAALGERPDVIFDCVSSQSSFDQAIALAERAGVIISVGVATGLVSLPLALVQDRELRIEGSAMYIAQDVERAMQIMASGIVPVDEIVTSTFPLVNAAEAFAAARRGDEIKVQVTVAP